MGSLHDRRHVALETDAVGAHRHDPFGAHFVEHGHPQRLGVLPAQLEDVAHLDGTEHFEGLAALPTGLPGGHLAHVHPLRHRNVSLHVHSPQMEVVLVRAGHQIRASPQRLVRQHGHRRHRNGAQTPRICAEQFSHLVGVSGPYLQGVSCIGQLLLLEGMVAPEQHQRDLSV